MFIYYLFLFDPSFPVVLLILDPHPLLLLPESSFQLLFILLLLPPCLLVRPLLCFNLLLQILLVFLSLLCWVRSLTGWLREQQERMRVEYEEEDRKRRIREEEVVF